MVSANFETNTETYQYTHNGLSSYFSILYTTKLVLKKKLKQKYSSFCILPCILKLTCTLTDSV